MREPRFRTGRALRRWHKDDSPYAMSVYRAQYPLTDELLHAHEVADRELSDPEVRAKARNSRYVLLDQGGYGGEKRALAVGRLHEPQAPTFTDSEPAGEQRYGAPVLPLGKLKGAARRPWQ